MNYREDILVDRYNLDELWEKQASLYVRYAEAYADAQAETKRADERVSLFKDDLEMVKAKLDAELRATWQEKEFKSQPTEAAISNWIIVQPLYREGVKKLRAARQDYIGRYRIERRLKAAVQGFDHRRSALEYLSRLMLGGYYANPNMPREFKDRADARFELSQRERIKQVMDERRQKE